MKQETKTKGVILYFSLKYRKLHAFCMSNRRAPELQLRIATHLIESTHPLGRSKTHINMFILATGLRLICS
jgi:hypothetical protein